jgi:branched-chain amino acid transport system permease protein
MGINSDDVIMLTFIIGSALAGTGGILASLDTDMTPTMGLNALLMGIVALIAGGMGSNVGAILGGFLIALAQNLGVWKLPTQWQQAIVFGILLLFLILRPRGVLGVRARATGV